MIVLEYIRYDDIYGEHPTHQGTTLGMNCPHCKVFVGQDWTNEFYFPQENPDQFQRKEFNRNVFDQDNNFTSNDYSYVFSLVCPSCKKTSIWIKEPKRNEPEQLVFPKVNKDSIEPNTDMPASIKKVFIEASTIINDSPRASAALSRLAIDMLTSKITPEGKNLNDRIRLMVSLGMPTKIQQGLDIVRVVGNNAVHPGEIDLSDDKEIAKSLLSIINLIVDNQISQPKRISEMYGNLPTGALDAIKKRDQ